MKKLLVGSDNVVYLDAINCNEETLTVTATFIGEDGNTLLKPDETELGGITATWDTDKNKHKVTATFHPDTIQQYVRIYWRVEKDGVWKQLPDEFDPEECNLGSRTVENLQSIIPIEYFLDFVLSPESKMDEEFEEAVRNFPRDGLRRYLLAAQGNVESMLKMNFFKETFTEVKDYTWDQLFGDTFWIQQMYHRPVVSVTSWDLYHGSTKILSIPPKDIIIEKTQGTIEYVPTAASGGLLFQSLLASGDGITMAVIGRGSASRLPCAWHITYEAGLDFPSLKPSKKENFRLGVARNALIELLPQVDPSTRVTTQSESIDGVSGSSSKSVDSIIKQLRQSQDEWKMNIEKEYATGFDMVIV